MISPDGLTEAMRPHQRVDQLLGQVEEGGPRPCGLGGNFQLKYGDDRIFVLLTERGARA